MKDNILKVVAYFSVFGLDIYGVKYCNVNCGKGNLYSYFNKKYNWSEKKIKNICKILANEEILTKSSTLFPPSYDKSIKGPLYKLSLLYKIQLKYLEIEC